MPFPQTFQRDQSDRTAKLCALPAGSELVYSVIPYRSFEVAVAVVREGTAALRVTVVVYSVHYPHNFDVCIDWLQQLLRTASSQGAGSTYVLHDQRYGNPRMTNIPRPDCLSCFDEIGYIGHYGIPVIVLCRQCGRDSADLGGTFDQEGNCKVVVDFSKIDEDKKEEMIKLVKHNNRLVTGNQRCHVCLHLTSKKCSSCKAVVYCSAFCQRHDWNRHKPHCRKAL